MIFFFFGDLFLSFSVLSFFDDDDDLVMMSFSCEQTSWKIRGTGDWFDPRQCQQDDLVGSPNVCVTLCVSFAKKSHHMSFDLSLTL